MSDNAKKYTPTVAQSQAVNANGKVLVAAGAGSGKTTTMIQRILRNLEDGASLRSMLILVYNNFAADELKEKLHQALFEASANEGEKSKIFGRELDELPFAQIGTIHSFCQKLIRENFEKLGISPTFEVLDEVTHKVYMNEALENVFLKYAEENDSDFDAIVEIFSQSRKEENLKDNIIRLYKQLDIQPNREEFLSNVRACFESFEQSDFIKTIFNEEKNIMIKARNECNKILPLLISLKQDRYADSIVRIANLAGDLSNCGDLFDMIKIANRGFTKDSPKRKANASDEIVALTERAKSVTKLVWGRLLGLYENFPDMKFLEMAHLQNKNYIEKLIEIALRFEDELARLKTEDGYLSFQDLEHKAVELISLGEHFEDNFDFVYVDEYQDVNPMQEYIISHMIKDNCFVVGDVKQSIYGFRLADPTIFLNRQRSYLKGEGESINFNKNFRSEKSILNFVNAIFDVCMTLETADMDYKGEARFDTDNKEIAANVQLHIFSTPKCEKESVNGIYRITEHVQVETENASENEGKFIAREIKTLIGRAKTDNNFLDFGDIAILFRSRNAASQKILGELEKEGIPIDDGAFAKSDKAPESELVSFLKVIDNPLQDLPLAGFLLSYFGGYNETDLAEIAEHTGNSFYEKLKLCAINNCKPNINAKIIIDDDNEISVLGCRYKDTSCTADGDNGISDLGHRLKKTLGTIADYRVKSSFKSVSELMLGIVSDFSYDAYLMRHGESSVNSLSAFIADSALFENISLSKFLRKYEESDENNENKSSGGNRVHISTFHGYKGQEIPVVFVADIATAYKTKSSSGDLIFDGKGYIGIKFFDKSTRTKHITLSKLGVARRIRERETKEEMRLLYVALTRAKQYLYVTGAISKVSLAAFGIVPKLELASSNLDHLSNAIIEGELKVCTIFHKGEEILSWRDEKCKTPVLQGGDKDIEKLIKKSQEYIYPHKFATELAMKYSVSTLDNSDETTVRVFEESANVGTIYHKVMEHINYDCEGEDGVVAELKRMVSDGLLTEEEKNIVKPRDISLCLSSKLMQLARQSVCLREQSFMIYLPANELKDEFDSTDKVLVQGVVDLIIDGEQKIIVDFKNSYLKDEEMLKKYKKQLYLYKKAVKGIIHADSIKVVLYSFKTGKTVEL